MAAGKQEQRRELLPGVGSMPGRCHVGVSVTASVCLGSPDTGLGCKYRVRSEETTWNVVICLANVMRIIIQ